MSEKSTCPSIGELISMPFQSTFVWEEDVPLNEIVERDARPDCLTKTDELYVRRSDSETEIFSLKARVSNTVTRVPVPAKRRDDVTRASLMSRVSAYSSMACTGSESGTSISRAYIWTMGCIRISTSRMSRDRYPF